MSDSETVLVTTGQKTKFDAHKWTRKIEQQRDSD